jgi:hypothetical protein
VERFHRRRKEALRARLTDNDWHAHLAWVVLGLRAAPHEDSAVSAAELVFGTPLALPGAIITTTEPPPHDFVHYLTAGVPCVAPLPPLDPSNQPAAPASSPLHTANYAYIRSPPGGEGPFSHVMSM